MNISDLNKLSIRNYLAQMNIHPVKDRGYYAMYHSPFRTDDNASMKVDFQKNLWIDFGSNEGGTMIDLVMLLNRCTLNDAMQELNRYNSTSVNQYNNTTVQQQSESFSFHGNNSNNNNSAISILKVVPITNKALIDYLTERKINEDIAKQHCKEIYYSANQKPYFAIGFKNDSGGYELRNKYFKGCTSKDITTGIRTDSNNEACIVFEGFMDFLSYLTMKNIQNSKVDIVVLNSISNLSKAMDFIKLHPKVYCYLDNDEAGKKATQIIKELCPTVIDQSVHYTKYKDLNEHLISTKQIQQKEKPVMQEKRKPSRGFRR